MTQQTRDTIRAAQNWTNWGAYAAARFATKRGVHPALVRLARQLEAVKGA